MTFRAVERASASDGVRDQILELIRAGHLEVGAKLPSEQELARSFGVSRPVVREGLGRLRAIGVIEGRPGSGSFVKSARIAPQGLLPAGGYTREELHQVRCEIEVPGAALAAALRTRQQLAVLMEIAERHTGDPNSERWVADDLDFHVTLAEASRNSLRVRFVTELHELASELLRAIARTKGGREAAIGEHAAIVDAVRRQDEDAARGAMLVHLERSRDRLAPNPT